MNDETLHAELSQLHATNQAVHMTEDPKLIVLHGLWSKLKDAAQVRLLTECSDRLSLVPDPESEHGDLYVRVTPPLRGIRDAKHMPQSVAVDLGVWRSE